MNVAIYTRVSSEDQHERGTIQTQIEFAYKYCELHKLNMVKLYKDDGISGTVPVIERPEGKLLMKDLKNKEFDTLLVYKLDRLGRSARIILNTVHELEQLDVKIKSMTEPFDTSDPSGRFMLTMLAGVADLERETILERMWQGANRAARDGKWLGGIVPYGYFVDEDKFLQINNEIIPSVNMSEVDVIKLIFKLINEEKYSTIATANYLNSLNIPTSYSKDNRKLIKGKRRVNTASIWRPNTIQRIINNKTYMGIHEYGKRSTKEREIIERKVPAIITKSEWESAQLVISKSPNKPMQKKKNIDYLLQSLIKCGRCEDTSYSGVNYGKGRVYYACINKLGKKVNEGKCYNGNLPRGFIEDLVWNDIVGYLKNPGIVILSEFIDLLEDRIMYKTNLIEEQKLIMDVLQEKENIKNDLFSLFRKKIISETELELQLLELNNEEESINKRKLEIEKELLFQNSMEYKNTTSKKIIEPIKVNLKNMSIIDKQNICRLLVHKIVVNKIENSTSVRIYYNFINFDQIKFVSEKSLTIEKYNDMNNQSCIQALKIVLSSNNNDISNSIKKYESSAK